MKTTLRELINHRACRRGLRTLMVAMNCSLPDALTQYISHDFQRRERLFEELNDSLLDKPIPYSFILESNGINDTLWLLNEFIGLYNIPELVEFAFRHNIEIDNIERLDDNHIFADSFNDDLLNTIKKVINDN